MTLRPRSPGGSTALLRCQNSPRFPAPRRLPPQAFLPTIGALLYHHGEALQLVSLLTDLEARALRGARRISSASTLPGGDQRQPGSGTALLDQDQRRRGPGAQPRLVASGHHR